MPLIPFDDRDGVIWFDGKLVPWRDAKIHVLTHGLHYGSCVFEGERSYEGQVFRCSDHSVRLAKSAALMDMDFPWSPETLDAAKKETLRVNNIVDGYIRAVAWRGSEQMGISAQATKTHLAIACWVWPSYFSAEKRENGISLKTSRWRKPAPDTAPVHAKAAGLYMIGTMSKHAAEKDGFDDALMLDYRGRVAEATGANLFAVENGVLKTPIPDCFLNGLTRQTVIGLAKDFGIPFEETVIMPEDLGKFSEIFVTGSAAEVMAVGRIDEKTYTVGPITRKLRLAYENLVRDKPLTAGGA